MRRVAVPALATAMACGATWLAWEHAPALAGALGLGWLEPLVRVGAVFAVLSALEAIARRLPPSDPS